MCVMFVRRFEPRGRRFTNFHYYYCCYNDDADDYSCYGHYYYSYGVKKNTKIIKLTNLEGHARVLNTQQTLLFFLRPFIKQLAFLALLQCQKWKLFYGWFMGCYFLKVKLTLTHVYTRFRVQALYIRTLTLGSNDSAHSSDQNSPSTGPESHTTLTALKTVLSLSTDVVLAKWSAITFAS